MAAVEVFKGDDGAYLVNAHGEVLASWVVPSAVNWDVVTPSFIAHHWGDGCAIVSAPESALTWCDDAVYLVGALCGECSTGVLRVRVLMAAPGVSLVCQFCGSEL